MEESVHADAERLVVAVDPGPARGFASEPGAADTGQDRGDDLVVQRQQGRQPSLKVTDPEFVELFDNLAFDEVIAYGNLSTQTRLKVILASLIARQTVNEYKVMLGGALNVGVTR